MHFCIHCAHMYVKSSESCPNAQCFTCIVRLSFSWIHYFEIFFSASMSLCGFRTLHLPVSIPRMDSVVTFLWLFLREVFMVFPNDLKNICKDNYTFI